MLRNHLFLCNLLFFSAPFQTLYAPKAVSTKRPIKALKLPTQSMIQLDLPQISLSISPQILAGSANAQFGKTQFFLRHPVCLCVRMCARKRERWANCSSLMDVISESSLLTRCYYLCNQANKATIATVKLRSRNYLVTSKWC